MEKIARKLCVGIVFLSVAVISPSWGWADESAEEEQAKLDDVVVTATRDMTVINTPASISVITAQDLEDMGAKNIGEALVRVPGVFDDGAAKYYLSIRGTRASSSGGPLVLLDGVPQDQGISGYNNLETIPVSDIERIEVLRSPGTTAFGSDSARGVISIITKSGEKDQPLKTSASVSYGSWNTLNANASLSGGREKWDYFLNSSFTDTDGYVHDDQTQSSLRMKGRYHIDAKSHLGINLGFADNEYETVRGKNLYALEQDRRADEFREAPGDDLTSYNEAEQQVYSAALDYGRKNAASFFNALAAATHFDESSNSRYSIYSSPGSVYEDDRDQDRYILDLSGGLHLGGGGIRYTPTLGANVELTTFENVRQYPNDPAGHVTSKLRADIDFDQDKYGLFFQNQLFFGERVELNAGIRRDDVSYDVKNLYGDQVDVSHTKYPWSVAPAYHWQRNATTYMSVGTSYWYPAPFYYQSAMQYMNPENLPQDLKPEESLTYEIGHKQRFGRWANLNVTLFYIEYKDKFAVFYDSSQSYAGYKNTGDSEHKGVELEMDGMLTNILGYRLAGTYMKAEWTSGRERVYTWETPTSRDFRDLKGYQLNRVPEYKYMIGIDIFPIENVRCNVDLNVTGPYWVDYLNRIEYDEKKTVDVGIRYERERWSIWLLAKNIFDEEIEAVYNSNGQLNTTAEDIALNGLYANDYYPRQGQYFEIGGSIRF